MWRPRKRPLDRDCVAGGLCGRLQGGARPLLFLLLALAVVSAGCTTEPGGGGSTGRVNAIPRDPGPCDSTHPVGTPDYFARADVTGLGTRAGSAAWMATLANWDVVKRGAQNGGGNLNIFWGNAPAAGGTGWSPYSYPVNFVNTARTDGGQSWPTSTWVIDAWRAQNPDAPDWMAVPNPDWAHFFLPANMSIWPMPGDYPNLRNGSTSAWHLGSPDMWGGEDRIVLFRDSGTCRTYEMGGVQQPRFGFPPTEDLTADAWHAQQGTTWNEQFTPVSTRRPATAEYPTRRWEPAGVGAAAIPLTPMVLRLDEVNANVATGQPLNHALYWAASTSDTQSCSKAIWPARHSDCGSNPSSDPTMPGQGAWLRLRSDFDETGYSPQMLVIIRTLKTRGMVFADGGTQGLFAEPGGCQAVDPGENPASATSAKCWTDQTLQQLISKPIPLADFEVLDAEPMRLDPTLDPDPNQNGSDPNDNAAYRNLWKCRAPYCG